MSNLNYIAKSRNHSKDTNINGVYRRGRRFYTDVDMAIIKHDTSIHNSLLKRGETEKKGKYLIYECGCGNEGCFIHREI